MPRRVEEEYDIRDVLGSGTCGEVRRAIHRHTGEQLAVKVIALGGRNRANRFEEASAAFEAEASILQALDHPYVVKLVDVFVSPGVAVYLVMELLHGGDLFDRIVKKGNYSEVESRRVMRRLLNAIFYLHEIKNVVHRDLKPENILMVNCENDVNVKLTDFGLAKSVTDDGLKTFCGTPQYFAPEVLRRRHTVAGRGRYGKQADMWSLGVILYILLSGMPPFDVSGGLDAVADAKIEFPPDKWRNLSDEAKDLVRLLLMADPKKRISVKDACKHKWIMTEDGDTHTYPLDDPAVSLAAEPESLANKRLFAREIDRSGGDTARVTVADQELSKRGPLVDTTVAETSEKGAVEPSSVPRVPVTEGIVQTTNVEDSGPESAKTFEPLNTEPKKSPDAPKATLPDDAEVSSSTAKPTSDTKQGVCKSPARGSPAVPLSLNARSNYFRETVLKSIEKASPAAASNCDEQSRNMSSEEKCGPKGILITPKSTNAIAIVSSRTSGAASSRPAVASKQKSKKHKVTVKVTPMETKASELTDDEICSQFSDEGDSIASFSTDDCIENMKPKAKATKRFTDHDAPPGQKRKKKRRIALGARAPVSNQDDIAVSDEDIVPKEGAPASEGAAKSKVVTSEKEKKAAKSKETSDDSKGQVGGRQTTLSNFFLKKAA
jgi:phosphorylase kinase gamma subunit/serine/threonine-protein kinase Chk2/calcium/calmodulin-dependent protein kinase I